MEMKKNIGIIFLAFAIIFMTNTSADAYLDPASGSALGATTAAFFAAIAFTLRKYFYKLMRLFRRNQERPSDSSDK